MPIHLACRHCGGTHYSWDCEIAVVFESQPQHQVTITQADQVALADVVYELHKIRELLEKQ